MAKATFRDGAGKEYTFDDIQNLAMSDPYWVVQRTNDVREFIHFNTVSRVLVEGEEELIQNARARAAMDLGVEA